MTVLYEWWMPVNVHPVAVRFHSEGPTRAVEPTEAGGLLPLRRLAPVMLVRNNVLVMGRDAHHLTSLTFPS